MSLSRLALRLAACEALCPAAALVTAGPYPTVAANRVDDSRVDLIAAAKSPEELDAALAQLEDKPLLVVYTEEHDRTPYGDVKFDARENVVTLVIEAMIGAKGIIDTGLVDQNNEPVTLGTLDAPATDRQHEAMLDLLESQVCYLLDPKGRAPSAALYRGVAMETRRIHSNPQRAADRAVRLASRTLKFHVKIRQECWPTAPLATPALPEPLATVAAGLPAGSSGARLCATLAGLVPVAPAVPSPDPTGGIVIAAAVDRAPGAAADVNGFVAPPTLSPPTP